MIEHRREQAFALRSSRQDLQGQSALAKAPPMQPFSRSIRYAACNQTVAIAAYPKFSVLGLTISRIGPGRHRVEFPQDL
jgi:hypothetical protein